MEPKDGIVDYPGYDRDGDGTMDVPTALDCDLYWAKMRIRELTGEYPEFVRPPYWKMYPAGVSQTYGHHNLKPVFADVYSEDKGFDMPWPLDRVEDVMGKCAADTESCARNGMRRLVVSFHDWNDQTARHLDWYMDGVRVGAQNAGLAYEAVHFCTSTEEVKKVLLSRYEKTWGGLLVYWTASVYWWPPP